MPCIRHEATSSASTKSSSSCAADILMVSPPAARAIMTMTIAPVQPAALAAKSALVLPCRSSHVLLLDGKTSPRRHYPQIIDRRLSRCLSGSGLALRSRPGRRQMYPLLTCRGFWCQPHDLRRQRHYHLIVLIQCITKFDFWTVLQHRPVQTF